MCASKHDVAPAAAAGCCVQLPGEAGMAGQGWWGSAGAEEL